MVWGSASRAQRPLRWALLGDVTMGVARDDTAHFEHQHSRGKKVVLLSCLRPIFRDSLSLRLVQTVRAPCYATTNTSRTGLNLVTWWCRHMETSSSLLAICAGNSPHKSQWRGALMIPLICVWINGWVNNRVAGDFRRYHDHYDVIVIYNNPWMLHYHHQDPFSAYGVGNVPLIWDRVT